MSPRHGGLGGHGRAQVHPSAAPLSHVPSLSRRAEHKKHVPSCGFLKVKDPYKITVENVLDLEKKALETFIVSSQAPGLIDPLLSLLQQREKKELEREITAVAEGMREQLVTAATGAQDP